MRREQARLDEWARELAPGDELGRWFGHDPAQFEEFLRRYVDELAAQTDTLREVRRRARAGRVALVYAARDLERNEAAVLAEVLRSVRRRR